VLCESFSIYSTPYSKLFGTTEWSISIPVACCVSLCNRDESSLPPSCKEAGQLYWCEYFMKSQLQNVTELNLQDGDGT